MNNKIKLRELLKELIYNNISDYSKFNCIIKKNFLILLSTLSIKDIAIFFSKKNEIDLNDIIYTLRKLKYKLSLPRIEDNLLIFREWMIKDKLQMNIFKVYEPNIKKEKIIPDLIIVPFLGFDRNGYRIGYGGGFYDRTLIYYPKALKVALGYSFQQTEDINFEAHDVPMDYIITEKEIIKVCK